MPSRSDHDSSEKKAKMSENFDRLQQPALEQRITQSVSFLSQKGIKASFDRFDLQSYSQDLWPRKLLELREEGPKEATIDLVVWPQSAEEVSIVVKWANQFDCTLYPYGAGSGVCGATIATHPNETLETQASRRLKVLVDLKGMRKVRSLDKTSLTVWAEAGWIGENLERYLNQEGYTLGHFPSSIYCSSLGGYLATRSAGQLSTKYGKIEDMVLTLEVVLPDGTITEIGRSPKSSTGPDWTQFLLGTEGTLVFFTAARLQIHPIPENRVMMGFGAGDIQTAIEFTRKIIQSGLRPAVLRIYDPTETSLTLNSEVLKKCNFAGGAAMVVIFEGKKRLTEAEAEEARSIAQSLKVQDLGPHLAEHWWEHRYDVSYKQQLILSHNRLILDTFELATTWDNLENVYRAVKKVKVGLGVILAHFSHFYHTGANIYFTLVSHAGFSQNSTEKYDQIWEDMLKAAYESGATLSHHHGIGVQKNEWLRKEKGPWINLFKRIKNGFDPENRLNPGKMGL